MLSQNIKNLRKEKGYTQETFAQELNVVRQTVSKWEKGYSVPDALMLEKIAELFEVSVGDLLSEGEVKTDEKPDLKEIADQLAILNNQYAKEMARRKRNRRIALIVLAVFFVLIPAFAILLLVPTHQAEVDDETGFVSDVRLEKELEKAVSKAIIDENSGGFVSGECPTESHFVFKVEEDGNNVSVFIIEDFRQFGFENGFFTDVSGGSTPSVLTFEKTNGGYSLISRETAGMGADYVPSIKALFPWRLAKRVIEGLSDENREEMWKNMAGQAQKYLDSIKREATVCQYSEIKTEFISDHGVRDEIVNKITEMCNEYDYTVGNHEKIENGKRYVYQTAFDDENGFVTFTKFEYESGKVVEFIAVDGETGEVVRDAEKPEKAEYYKGELSENEWTTASADN